MREQWPVMNSREYLDALPHGDVSHHPAPFARVAESVDELHELAGPDAAQQPARRLGREEEKLRLIGDGIVKEHLVIVGSPVVAAATGESVLSGVGVCAVEEREPAELSITPLFCDISKPCPKRENPVMSVQA